VNHSRWLPLILLIPCVLFLRFLTLPDLSCHGSKNPALLEAQSLLDGKIAIPQRVHDSALFGGKAYNVFQPGQTLFFLTHYLLFGEHGLKLFQLELLLVAVFSTLLLGQALLTLTGEQMVPAICITVSAIFGAPYLVSLRQAFHCSVYRVNHCMSLLFISLSLYLLNRLPPSAIGSRRDRLLSIGACIGAAVLFRAQHVLLVLLPLGCLLQDENTWAIRRVLRDSSLRRNLAQELVHLLLFPALAVLIIFGFQAFRFGNPLTSGYELIYVGRTDVLAERARTYGIFSLHFVPENLYRTFLALPTFSFDGRWRLSVVGDPRGNSLLLSQPLLLLFPLLEPIRKTVQAASLCRLYRRIGMRRLRFSDRHLLPGLRTARAQNYLLSALALAVPVWLYHNPGYHAPGYMRLSLDYLPLWVAALAASMRALPHKRYLSYALLLCALWAVIYAQLLL